MPAPLPYLYFFRIRSSGFRIILVSDCKEAAMLITCCVLSFVLFVAYEENHKRSGKWDRYVKVTSECFVFFHS